MALNALEPLVFLTILFFSFALFLVITGGFTAYFGSGKSRKIGIGLLIGGFLIGILWVALKVMNIITFGCPDCEGFNLGMWEVIIQTIVTVLAAVIGAAIAIGLFLLAIMKS